MSRIIRLLIDKGIYSQELDVRYAAFILTTLNTAPVLQAFALRNNGLTLRDMHSDRWLNFVASMLDQQFRNPRDLMGDSPRWGVRQIPNVVSRVASRQQR